MKNPKIKKICKTCKRSFLVHKCGMNRQFCCISCAGISKRGFKLSKSHRLKISKSIKGKERSALSKSHRQEIRNSWKQTREKRVSAIRTSTKRRWTNPDFSRKMRDSFSIRSRRMWSNPILKKKMLVGLTKARHSLKPKDTFPERIVKSILIDLKIRFIHPKFILNNSVDFYLPNHKTIIEVDGCLFHACQDCYPIPDGWICETKKDTVEIRYRDLLKDEKWRKAGYHIIRIWEHETHTEKSVADIRKRLLEI